MIDRRWHSSILNARFVRGADCDSEHCMVVVKVRERLAVSNQETQKFEVVRFNLRKLNELDVWKQYQIKISNRNAALENLSDGKDINGAWENIRKYQNLS